MRTFIALLGVFFTLPLAIWADEPVAKQGSPEEVVQTAFEALAQLDFDRYVALTHPDSKQEFHQFVMELLESDSTEPAIVQAKQLFAPIDSLEKAKQATPDQLLKTYMENGIQRTPGVKEMLATAKLQILGTITESPDRAYVIARSVLPRPQPAACEKHEGKWYQRLDENTRNKLSALRQMNAQGGKPANPAEKKSSLDSVEVVGHILEEEGRAQVLCRIEMTTAGIQQSILACYPVNEGEEAWNHLKDKDPAELIAALKKKWGA